MRSRRRAALALLLVLLAVAAGVWLRRARAPEEDADQPWEAGRTVDPGLRDALADRPRTRAWRPLLPFPEDEPLPALEDHEPGPAPGLDTGPDPVGWPDRLETPPARSRGCR